MRGTNISFLSFDFPGFLNLCVSLINLPVANRKIILHLPLLIPFYLITRVNCTFLSVCLTTGYN